MSIEKEPKTLAGLHLNKVLSELSEQKSESKPVIKNCKYWDGLVCHAVLSEGTECKKETCPELSAEPEPGEFTELPSTDYLRKQAKFCREHIGLDECLKAYAYDLERSANKIDRLEAENKRLKEVTTVRTTDEVCVELKALCHEHALLLQENKQQADEIEGLKELLEKILDWANAYPLEMFPKPTKDNWEQAAEVLKANGLSLDRFSADNMRHVLDGIKDIVNQALQGSNE